MLRKIILFHTTIKKAPFRTTAASTKLFPTTDWEGCGEPVKRTPVAVNHDDVFKMMNIILLNVSTRSLSEAANTTMNSKRWRNGSTLFVWSIQKGNRQ
jgi:hypothetical protein